MTKRDYLRRAEKCERLAQRVASEEDQKMLLKIASSWRELAGQSEAKLAVALRAGVI